MMKKVVCRFVLALFLSLFWIPFVFASYVDLDPDNYPSARIPDNTGAFMRCYGSSLSNLIDTNGYFLDYNSRQNFLANTTYSSPPHSSLTPSTKSYVYSWTNPNPWYTNYSQSSMHVIFGSYDSSQGSLGRFVYQPTNFAAIDFLWSSVASSISHADFKVYGANDALLGSYRYDKSGTSSHMSIFQSGIYRISVVPDTSAWNDYYGLDNLNFAQAGSGTIFDLDSSSNPSIKAPDGMTLAGNDSMTGSGTILGSLINNGGLLSPGHSPGTIVIDGDFTQDAGGRTVMEIGSDENDKLEISGQANFAGVLEILLDGFDCLEGEVITLMTYASFDGSFDEILGLNFEGGSFDLNYGATSLTMTANCAVPLPPSVWFLLSGFLGLIGARLRRKV